MGRLVNIKQLSEFLGVGKRTIYRMVEDGQIPKGVKRCASRQWDLDEVMASIENSPWTPIAPNSQTNDSLYLLDVMGCPRISMRGAEWSANNRPLVYAWVREAEVLYVGMSTKGVGRPFTHDHERLRNIQAEDRLHVWFVDTPEKALELEEFLIRNIKPAYNFTGTGRPIKATAKTRQQMSAKRQSVTGTYS